MFQDFKPDAEEFRGQRWLTTLLLLMLAAGMLAVGIKQVASGELLAGDTVGQTSGVIPIRLTIPGSGFEVRLAETAPDQQGQPAGAGWLKSSPLPGEVGTAAIGISQDWPVVDLQPGDHLEITGQAGEKLVFEITSRIVSTFSTVAVAAGGQPLAGVKGLKLVVVGPDNPVSGLVIFARLVATK
jgi:hypothetical protein